MSLSVRRQLRDATVACLQNAGIVGINTVSAWRQVQYSPEDLPALLVTDADASITTITNAMSEHDLSLEITVMTCGSPRMDDATEIAAAVLAAMGSDPYFGGLATWSEPRGTTINGEVVGNAVAFLQITLNVKYRTPLWKM